MPVMLPKLGALPVETIGLVVGAYLAIEKHHVHLYSTAGLEDDEEKSGDSIPFPLVEKPLVKIMRKTLLANIEEAIKSLEPYAR
jgi:hypothetical protein